MTTLGGLPPSVVSSSSNKKKGNKRKKNNKPKAAEIVDTPIPGSSKTSENGKGGVGVSKGDKMKSSGISSKKKSGLYSTKTVSEEIAAYDSNEDATSSDEEDEGRGGYRKGGYHPVRIGEWYGKHRYQVIRKLGWGHFSTVWLAKDTNTDGYVALKVVKSAPHYTEAALDEIKLLKTIVQNDVEGTSHVVHLLDNFYHQGPHGKHVVMVFEVLGKNILELIEKHYYGLPLPVVRSITRQILIALDFLHSKCQIIHTDLKPENVLLVQPLKLSQAERRMSEASCSKSDASSTPSNNTHSKKEKETSMTEEEEESVSEHEITTVKIADLGNGCWVEKHFTDDIQTRQYRAPEVILQYKYGTSADIWSLACMVFELATGDLLFKPKKGAHHSKSDDHLALMLELCDKKTFPRVMLQNGKKAMNYFKRNGQLRTIGNLKHWPLEEVLLEKYKFSEKDAVEMSSFLLPMLQLDPDRRCTAHEALQHPWLSKVDTNVPIPMEPNYSDDDMDEED